MQKRSKLVLVVVSATVLLSFAVGNASARRITVTSQGFRIVWPSLEFLATGTEVRCPVTLEGTFHSRTISKLSGQLIGLVTRALVGEAACANGTARALTETLPWHVQYNSFAGTLPNISSITIMLIGARFEVENRSLICLAGTTQRNPGFGIAINEAGGITRLRADETKTIPLERTEFFCQLAGSARFRGTAEVFVLGSTSRIRIALVQ